MENTSDNQVSSKKSRIQQKIRFLEVQLASLDHYLPETYDYLMQELDIQRRILAELEISEIFKEIDSASFTVSKRSWILNYKVLLLLEKISRKHSFGNKSHSTLRLMKKLSASRIQHLVPNNPQADKQLTGGRDWDAKAEERAKKETLYDSSYKTAAGHWKRRDEPGEPTKTEYLSVAPSALKKQQQWDARQRLKKKNAVPSREGKKLFDEFCKEAYNGREDRISKSEMRSIYNGG